tara:strand:- start:295 stop:1329 length:1035 start_codon:yes stop_codon:yes gene_type:complete
MAILNARSPKFVSISNTSISYAVLKLYIWDGLETSVPATPIYEIKKSVITGGVKVAFEIAELIRDQIDIIFDGNYNGQAVWTKADLVAYNSLNVSIGNTTQDFIAFDGYEYFESPTSPNVPLFITNREIFTLNDALMRIPIYTEVAPTAVFLKNGVSVAAFVYTSEPDSADQIQYIPWYAINVNVNTIEVYVSGTLIDTVIVKIIEECVYDPKKITFINKFGALQDMYFFKKSVDNISTKRESYKANILNQNNTYSTTQHVKRDFNITAQESTTLSSGFLNEEYNEVFKQMMLSEKIWVTNTDGQVLPLNIKTSSIQYKTSLNDRLVEYTFDFDNSFNVINNIR